jgi:hypothetical protein
MVSVDRYNILDIAGKYLFYILKSSSSLKFGRDFSSQESGAVHHQSEMVLKAAAGSGLYQQLRA